MDLTTIPEHARSWHLDFGGAGLSEEYANAFDELEPGNVYFRMEGS